jgi:transglutaminase/protease-like cytokinesis protein 3
MESLLMHFDDRYFKANPSEIIASHMPFDYMWQFPSPFQIKSFIMEVLVLINQKRFDFEAEIPKYYKSSELEQLIGSSARIKKWL